MRVASQLCILFVIERKNVQLLTHNIVFTSGHLLHSGGGEVSCGVSADLDGKLGVEGGALHEPDCVGDRWVVDHGHEGCPDDESKTRGGSGSWS